MPSIASRYEWITPALPNWTSVTFPVTVPFTLNAPNQLRLRAIDGAGNASAEDLVTVVHDNVPPPTPIILTPRLFVNATTTSVNLARSSDDASFARYESCVSAVSVGAACPASCVFAAQSASFALSLVPSQKSCVLARAIDVAGNASGIATVAVVSDLTRPIAPSIGPVFQASALTVRAQGIEVFVTAPATDLPLGGVDQAWVGIAYLETDTGAGFSALCPESLSNNAWNPCLAATRCADPRLRCRDGTVNGLFFPLDESSRNSISVRAVDLAGNTGDGRALQVENEGPRPLLQSPVTKSNPSLFGTTLAYSTSDQVNGRQPWLVELGGNRRFDLYEDPQCAVESLTPSCAYDTTVGAAGALYQKSDYSDGSKLKVMLRRRGPDGLFCTWDEPAPITLATLPSAANPNDFRFDAIGTAGERVVWATVETSANPQCGKVTVLDPGYNLALGDGNDVPTVVADYRRGSTRGLYVGEHALLVRGGGCPSNTVLGSEQWSLIQGGDSVAVGYPAGSIDFYVSTTRFTFEARAAALSADGLTLVFVDGAGLHVRRAGPDRQFNTSDDRTAVRAYPANRATYAYYGLSVDGSRIASFDYDSSGRADTVLTLRTWSAGANGVFEDALTSDDVVRDLSPSNDARTDPTLATGLLVYLQRSNIYAADLSEKKWEAVAPRPALWPWDTGGGSLLYVTAGQYTGETALRVRGANGDEVSSTLGTNLNHLERPVVGEAGNVLVAGRSATNSRQGIVLAPGADGRWLTGDDVRQTIYSHATNEFRLGAVGDGKALVFAGSWLSLTPYVLEPRGASWAVDNVDLVDVRGSLGTTSQTSFAAVSQRYASWIHYPNPYEYIAVRGSGNDKKFGTADDLPTATLKKYPGSPGVQYSLWNETFALAGRRVAFLEDVGSGYPSKVNVVDFGADNAFNTADDLPTTIALPYPWKCSDDCSFAMAGDYLAFVLADNAGTDQTFVVDLRTRALSQISFHDSRKSHINVASSGRVYWSDAIFPVPSIWSFVP